MDSTPTGTAPRSPIKGTVARQAGQGLQEYFDAFLNEESLRAVLPLGFAFIWLLLDLLNRFTHRPTPLWVIGLFLAFAIVNFIVRFRKVRIKSRQLRQGLDGERYVAQIIERDLLPAGYRVIHDLPMERGGRKFNIDHLLIGPNGVFCVETKAWSKPFRGETVATYDGSKILLNGVERCGKAIGQARAIAKIAEEQILKVSGISVKVTPFVVCVGWYVRKLCSGTPDVLVVNEEALAAFVEKCPGSLAPADVDRIWQRMKETFT